MNATPESFKPGERWLAGMRSLSLRRDTVVEVVCLEWSTSSRYVKIRHVQSGIENWESGSIELLERLPDVESGNHKTGQTSGVEAPCGQCACCRWVIEKQRKEICEAIEKGGIKYDGERGKTFSVLTSIEAEIEKRKRD